jgi:hypothetical protein
MSQVLLPPSLHPNLPLTALAPMQDVTNHWFMKVIAHYGGSDGGTLGDRESLAF